MVGVGSRRTGVLDGGRDVVDVRRLFVDETGELGEYLAHLAKRGLDL